MSEDAVTPTPHEEEASAERYLAGPGRKPTPEQRAHIRDVLADKPARRIELEPLPAGPTLPRFPARSSDCE